MERALVGRRRPYPAASRPHRGYLPRLRIDGRPRLHRNARSTAEGAHHDPTLAVGTRHLGGLAGYDRDDGGRGAAEVVGRVRDQTDGNPLYVGEIARLLASEGRLGHFDDVGLPRDVRETVLQRVAPGSAAHLRMIEQRTCAR